MQKKKISQGGRKKHNSKLSSESPYSILHIASISLCIIFSIRTVKEGGKGREITESSTQHRTESNDEGRESPATAKKLNNDAPIQYCTQFIIQIYTDSGVMYKNENRRNLRHYARVFSISRLHLSSKKLADNTKGHLKFFKNHKLEERKKIFLFSGSKSLDISTGQKSFICSCPHYKC